MGFAQSLSPIQKIVSSNSDFLWTKLDKNFFGLKQYLYLCNCYIQPETSEVHKAGGKSYFEILKDEVVKFGTQGEIILFGDMNSQTGELKEKYTDLDDDITVREQIYIERVSSTEGLENKIRDRNNEDTRVNSYGRKLISLTEQAHLAIVNGRKLGDTLGKTICVTYNGMSTVDYCIVSTSMFDEIVSFSVLDQMWYSDHNPFTCSLKKKIVTEREDKIQEGDLSQIHKFLWGENTRDEYKLYMSSEVVQGHLERYYRNSHVDVDTALEDLTLIIHDVASNTMKQKNVSNIKEGNTKQTQGDIDKRDLNLLRSQKRLFATERKLFRQDIQNKVRRIKFIKARRMYRKVKYQLKTKTNRTNYTSSQN